MPADNPPLPQLKIMPSFSVLRVPSAGSTILIAVVDADNDAHSGNPPYYNRYKMENLKTNWKLLQKTEKPRSQQEIGCGEIENILKTAGFILFFLKKIAPSPAKFQKAAGKSGHQVGKTALKWLDNTVKSCPKIGWRNRRFSTIQQRKKPATSFLSQAYGGDGQIWTAEWGFCRPLPYHLATSP